MGGNRAISLASPTSCSISMSSAIISILGLGVRLVVSVSRICSDVFSTSRRNFLAIFFTFLGGAVTAILIGEGALSGTILVDTTVLSFLRKSVLSTSLSFVLSIIFVCISTSSFCSGICSTSLTIICSIFFGIGFTFNFSKTLVDIYYIR